MNKCSTKTFYATKREARQAKKGIRKKFHSPVKFYKCLHCSGWHLTTVRTDLERHFKSVDLQCKFKEMIYLKKAEFIRRISNRRTVWRIVLDKKGYTITYDKKTKISKINYYFKANS